MFISIVFTFIQLNLILSLRNSQVHTFCWASPSSTPTLFLDGLDLHISLVHWRIVSRCAGGFVVPSSLGCADSSEPDFASCFGSEKKSSAVYLVLECLYWFVGVVFGAHHPNILLHSSKGDSSGFGVVALEVGWSCSWGLLFIGSLGFVAVMVLLVGGISQSFLNSKRFPDIFPALGQGVLVWSGAFSNAGGLFSYVKGF